MARRRRWRALVRTMPMPRGNNGLKSDSWAAVDRAPAATNAIEASPLVDIVVMGDLFKDHLDSSRVNLTNLGADKRGGTPHPQMKAKTEMTPASDWLRCVHEGPSILNIDYVILTTPPSFRPETDFFRRTEKGRHVFAGKSRWRAIRRACGSFWKRPRSRTRRSWATSSADLSIAATGCTLETIKKDAGWRDRRHHQQHLRITASKIAFG